MKKASFFIVLATIIISSLYSCGPDNTKDKLTLADASIVWWMAPGVIAQEKKIYDSNKLDLKSFDVQTGLASKNAVLSGSADVGLVASTPLAMGAFHHDNLIVLCSYVESKSLISLYTLTTDTARHPMPQAPIAVVKGTISEIYLFNYLNKYFKTETDKIIQNELNVAPPGIENALVHGDAKSATIWEPFGTIINTHNNKFKEVRDTDIYTHRIYIVTTPEVLKRKRSALEKFVKSFTDASKWIQKNPAEAKALLTSKFQPQKASIEALWDKVDFSIHGRNDYDEMKRLILKDAETATALHQTPKDDSGKNRSLNETDLKYYFDHDFKLTK